MLNIKNNLIAGMSMTNHLRSFLLFTTLILFSSPAMATPSIADMFANFASSAEWIIHLVVGAGFVMGLAIGFQAALSLKDYAEQGGRTSLKTPLTMMLVAALLVALPGTINMATETLSLGQNTALSVFSVGGGSSAIAGMDSAIKGVLLFVKMIGHIAIIRGLLMIKKEAEGKQGPGMGAALTHILGGAAAVNINATIAVLSKTVGLTLPI